MLISILVWVVTIGRIDVLHLVSVTIYGMSKTGIWTEPRVFGYLKKDQRRVVVDSRDPIYRRRKRCIES
jgi:hypothetical protein